jgi:hypothetical protein
MKRKNTKRAGCTRGPPFYAYSGWELSAAPRRGCGVPLPLLPPACRRPLPPRAAAPACRRPLPPRASGPAPTASVELVPVAFHHRSSSSSVRGGPAPPPLSIELISTAPHRRSSSSAGRACPRRSSSSSVHRRPGSSSSAE